MTLTADLLAEIRGKAEPSEPPDGWASTVAVAQATGRSSPAAWMKQHGVRSMRLARGYWAWNLDDVLAAMNGTLKQRTEI